MGPVVIFGRHWPLLRGLGRPRDGPASSALARSSGMRANESRSKTTHHEGVAQWRHEGVWPAPGALLPAPPRGGRLSTPSAWPGHPRGCPGQLLVTMTMSEPICTARLTRGSMRPTALRASARRRRERGRSGSSSRGSCASCTVLLPSGSGEESQYTGCTLILPTREQPAGTMLNKALTCTCNINFTERVASPQ